MISSTVIPELILNFRPFAVSAEAVAASVFFIAAALADLKDRNVPDRLWIVMTVSVLPFLAADLSADILTDPFSRKMFFRFFIPCIVLVFGNRLFRSGLFGGADLKAVIIFSFLFPEIRLPGNPVILPAIVPVLMMTSFFSSYWILFCLYMNVRYLLRRDPAGRYKTYFPKCLKDIFLLFVSYPCDIADGDRFSLTGQHDPGSSPEKRPVFHGIGSVNGREREQTGRLKKDIEEGKIPKIQRVSPPVPFLLPFAAGVLSVFTAVLFF